MDVIVEKDIEKLRKEAAEELGSILRGVQNNPVLLLLAGGSSFSFLEFVDAGLFSSRIIFTLSDQRFSTDPKINNWDQLQATNFYKKITEKGAVPIDMSVDPKDTLESYADRIEKKIREWTEQNPNGNVIATFGIGPDGHTEGIMPFPEDPSQFAKLFESEKWFVGYDAGEKNQFPLRVTITNTFIQTFIKKGVSYATGTEKRGALSKIFSATGSRAETPARILIEIPELALYTDISL